jgi:hypothetical protein
MPTGNNYFIFALVNLGFIAQIALMMYYTSASDIKNNWNQYRCNPSYWIYSDDVSSDFNYCVQNSQVNMMGTILQPMTYMVSSLASFAQSATNGTNNARGMLSNIRGFVSDIIPNIFGIFTAILVELQKMIIAIKDMVAKMIGVITTFIFMLDGFTKLLSAGAGTFSSTVKFMSSCFHPDTKVKTKSGDIYSMKDLPLGVELEDGGKVFSVMKLDNANKSPFYKISGGVNGDDIYVTGDHFIYDKELGKFIKVKDYSKAIIQPESVPDWVSCLITTNQRIPIGEHIFWDWEDDELTK